MKRFAQIAEIKFRLTQIYIDIIGNKMCATSRRFTPIKSCARYCGMLVEMPREIYNSFYTSTMIGWQLYEIKT